MRTPGRLVALAACAALTLALVPTAWAATPGPAYSWGTNDQGRLGTGGNTNADFNLPVAMAAPSQFTSLAAGSTHGCGLGADGVAWCWGDDSYGQLGNGTAPGDDSVPVAVNGGRSYNLISAGADSSCATADDTIYCWGRNNSGQLGNGTLTDSSIPVPVSEARESLTDIDSISVGGSSACAVANAADNVHCWGSNAFGQLGNGTTTDDTMPRPVADFVNRTTDNGMGASDSVNGVYATDDTIYAATLQGLAISTNGGQTFANTTVGGGNYVTSVYAVGSTVYAATQGGISISTDGGTTFYAPRTIANGLGSDNVSGVFATDDTIYAATTRGLSISTNGGTSFTNDDSTVGLGSDNVRSVYAVGSTIYAGTSEGLSISTNGGTSYTNYNSGLLNYMVRGVFATDDTVYVATDMGLGISSNGGVTFTTRTTADGLGRNDLRDVYASGSNVYVATGGGLSISQDGGTTFTNYTTFNGLGDNYVDGVYATGDTVYAGTTAGLSISLPDYAFAEVSVGGSFACGVVRASGPTGPGACWGDNTLGQLARGSAGSVIDSSVPVKISRPSGALSDLVLKSIATGVSHACAISLDDSVYCWGWNQDGQLGIGSSGGNVATPTRVTIPGNVPVRDVSAGAANSCAITDDTTYCWGYGGSGALGNGSSSNSTIPTAVTVTGINAQNSPAQVVSGQDYNAFIVKPRMNFLDGTAFASVQVGQSTSTAVTVRNVRPGSMTITGTSVTGQGVSIAPGGTCSGILLPTYDCTVNLTWTPTTGGPLSGASLTISYIGNSSTTPLTGAAIDVTSPPSISPSAQILTGAVGTAVTPTARFTAANFTSAPAYSIYPLLPAGLTLDRATGMVSGTPTVAYPSTRHWITASTPGGSQTASSTLQITVNAAPPSPPRDVNVAGGDASIAVTWQAPQSDGGSAITGYNATATPGGASCTTVDLTCTITGLTNGTSYTVAVTATNATGTSSAASAGPVTPGKPVITITGSRDGQRITVTGSAVRLDGESVRPWIRFPGEKSFSQGAAVIPVAADGSFTWSRRSGKKIYVYVAHNSVRSNTVTIPAR